MNVVGTNLKKYRGEAGLSQQELANRIAVTRQTISNWERGVSLPDIDMIIALAKEFHVDVEDILYKERPVGEFLTSKPKRIKQTCFWVSLFLATIILNITLVPWLYANRIYNVTPFSIASIILRPLVYILGSIAFLSLLSIWFDFRIENKSLPILLKVPVFVFTLLYVVFMLFSTLGPYIGIVLDDIIHSGAIFNWLASCPVIFIFPGVMLFCGFNKKPSKKH